LLDELIQRHLSIRLRTASVGWFKARRFGATVRFAVGEKNLRAVSE